MNRNSSRLNLIAIAALALIGVATEPSDAVVGRPLTPVSYAGVARRSVRRSAYVGAAAAPVAVGAAAATATIAALPGGCVFGAGIYTCGAVRYRPYYDGPTVVYRVVP